MLVSAQIPVSILLDVLSLILLTFPEKSISVPSVLYRRAQISSQVCIKHPQLDHRHPPSLSFPDSHLYPFVQLGPSLVFPSPFISPPTLSASNFRPEPNSFEKKKSLLISFFYSPMATSLQPSTSPTDTRPTPDELKQSPPAFLDLADSVSPSICAPRYSSAPLIWLFFFFFFKGGEIGL